MQSYIRNILLVCFPVSVLFVFIPSELYLNNLKEWGGDHYLVIFFSGLGLIFGIFLYFIIRLFVKLFPLNISEIANWLFFIGVFFIIADILAPLQLGLLDGSDVLSTQPLFYTLLEGIIFLLCLFGGFYIRRRPHQELLVFISAASMLLFVMYLGHGVKSSKSFSRDTANLGIQHGTTTSIQRPNIYHIVLDEMQTDYFLELLNNPDYEKKLKGFFIFKNNVSNYPYTSASTASYLSGTLYSSGSYSKWTSETSQKLLRLVSNAGYDLYVYSKPSVIKADSAVRYVSPDELLRRSSNHPMLKEFTRLWLARVSPNFMTNLSLTYGARLGDFLSSIVNRHRITQPGTIGEGVEPFAGVLTLRDVAKTEKERLDSSSYLYAHPILPHGPFVLDRKCNYVGRLGDNIAYNALEQSECALYLLCEVIDEIRSLGRFDESLIIVHSDHGSGWAGFLSRNESSDFRSSLLEIEDVQPFRKDIHPWSLHHLESRSMALLMIKPPLSKSGLRIVDVKTQLLDVYPTILDYAGIEYDSQRIDGLSLRGCISTGQCEKHNERERFFYYFPPSGVTDVFEKLKILVNDKGRPSFYLSEKLQKRRPYLTPGEHVHFSKEGEGAEYIVNGWSGQEPTHRWSNGPKAEMEFKLREKPLKNLVLRLKANAYLGGGRSYQAIGIDVNGQNVATWQMKGLDWYEALIPSRLVDEDGLLKVIFNISDPTSPAEVGASSDSRRLGIAARELVIVER
jgi:hypothetical protein